MLTKSIASKVHGPTLLMVQLLHSGRDRKKGRLPRGFVASLACRFQSSATGRGICMAELIVQNEKLLRIRGVVGKVWVALLVYSPAVRKQDRRSPDSLGAEESDKYVSRGLGRGGHIWQIAPPPSGYIPLSIVVDRVLLV